MRVFLSTPASNSLSAAQRTTMDFRRNFLFQKIVSLIHYHFSFYAPFNHLMKFNIRSDLTVNILNSYEQKNIVPL